MKEIEALGDERVPVPSQISSSIRSRIIECKRAKKISTTHPQLVLIGGHNVSGIEGVTPSTTDHAKKVFVIAWREVDDFWGNALDAHEVEGGEKTEKLEWKGPVSTLERARTGA